MGEQSYNYYTPVVNRPETILAVVITFLVSQTSSTGDKRTNFSSAFSLDGD